MIKTKADRSDSTGKALQETDSWLRKTNNRRSKQQSWERNPDMTLDTLYPHSVSCSGPCDPRAWQQSDGVLWPVATVGWREGLLRLLAPRGRHPLERQRQAGGGCAHQGERSNICPFGIFGTFKTCQYNIYYLGEWIWWRIFSFLNFPLFCYRCELIPGVHGLQRLLPDEQ